MSRGSQDALTCPLTPCFAGEENGIPRCVCPVSAPAIEKDKETTLLVKYSAHYGEVSVASLVRIFLLAFVCILPLASLAQPGENGAAKLVVGTIDVPPFAMKTDDGNWEGLSLDLLDMITSKLGREYEVREFTDSKALFDAAKAGTIDLIPALAARQEAEKLLDLTQPYYRSGFAIAVSRNDASHGWLGYFRALEAGQFLLVIGALLLLWLLAGSVIWLLERRHNEQMFGGSTASGLGHGIWWAAVTMTTVGYGDKAPVTVGGRLVAIVWMFASIILVSSFTASISASLTAEKLVGKVRGVQDLPHVNVGIMVESTATQWLQQRGISSKTFPSPQAGLQAIADGKIDAFVFDEAVLKSMAANQFAGSVYVLPDSFEHYYVSMAVQNNSSLREPINLAMLGIMATDTWSRLLDRHIAEGR